MSSPPSRSLSPTLYSNGKSIFLTINRVFSHSLSKEIIELNKEEPVISRLTKGFQALCISRYLHLVTSSILTSFHLKLDTINEVRKNLNFSGTSDMLDRIEKSLDETPSSYSTGVLVSYSVVSAYLGSIVPETHTPLTNPRYEHTIPAIPAKVWYGREFLQDIATGAVRRRFLIALERNLDIELARILLDYYVIDIWSSLSTTTGYLNIERISTQDFRSRGQLLGRALLNDKTGGASIHFVNMKQSTARKYFTAIFPYEQGDIDDIATSLVHSKVMYGIQRVDIRSAFVLAMKNRMYLEGIEEVQYFHDNYLFPEFLRLFRVMPYVDSKGRHTMKDGCLCIGSLPLN